MLELAPQQEVSFTLADATQLKRNVSEGDAVMLYGQGHPPLVVLGESGFMDLVGVVAPEPLGLVLHATNRIATYENLTC